MGVRRDPITWQQWLIAGYAAFIEIWLFLHFVVSDRFWPVAIRNTTAFYLFLPLLPLVVLAALAPRRRLLLGLLLFPLLVFLAFFGVLFLPRLEAPPAGTRLTAMSYNVLHSNRDFEAIAAVVRGAQPDLLGFQELNAAHAAELPRLLADYPYHALTLNDGFSGVGLTSRYPIESAEAFHLPPRDLALRAVVNVDGRRLIVYVVHLSPNNLLNFPLAQLPSLAAQRYADRLSETTQLNQELAALAEPVLLLCDCNLTDSSAAYGNLKAVLGDSFREAGWGFGHTLQGLQSPVPLQRIDYVWHSDEFFAVAAQVGERGGSDHRPVWAELVWTEPP